MHTIWQHPFLSFAFRPLYMLAALFVMLAILFWVFGFQGTSEVSGFLWHAREMVWGYTGAIIVAFLLTAVATWTGMPALRGAPLAILVLLWLLARVILYVPQGLLLSASISALFYLFALLAFAYPIVHTHNHRNYLPIAALLLFMLTGIFFDVALLTQQDGILNVLFAGVLMVAGMIGFIGMRVVPFFVSRRLGIMQVTSPQWVMRLSLLLPALAVILLLSHTLPQVVMLLCVVSGVLYGIQWVRWWQRDILSEPLLWILFVGFGFTALGLLGFGLSYFYAPTYLSAATHLITVGGIGVMTLGMMARTALGHTGRAMKLSSPMPLAFILMSMAAIIRPLAFINGSAAWYYIGIYGSGILFSLAMLLFLYRYMPYLWQERLDKQHSVLKIIR